MCCLLHQEATASQAAGNHNIVWPSINTPHRFPSFSARLLEGAGEVSTGTTQVKMVQREVLDHDILGSRFINWKKHLVHSKPKIISPSLKKKPSLSLSFSLGNKCSSHSFICSLHSDHAGLAASQTPYRLQVGTWAEKHSWEQR